MKKLLALLFSLFLLSPLSVFADDISDLQIEGMSIGDSLLDYMTEKEILEWIEITQDSYYYLNEPNKYGEVYLFKDFSTYDFVSFMIKNKGTNTYITNKNEKYTIFSIRGEIKFVEDFNSCIKRRDEIAVHLSKMFPNAIKDAFVEAHNLDPSGNSIVDGIDFLLSSGESVTLHCSNWEETFRIKNSYTEGLSVSIDSKEIFEWMTAR